MIDPVSLGLLMAIGAGGAAAVSRWRRKGAERVDARRAADGRADAKPAEAQPAPAPPTGAYQVDDVLLFLGEEFWLAGQLAVMREGTATLMLYPAPERGRDRWMAAPRQGDALYVLEVDATLARLGWPGAEVPDRGATLRRSEEGACTFVPTGEVPDGWSGGGRYAVFRSLDTVAVFVEQGANHLALRGKTVPRRLVERLRGS